MLGLFADNLILPCIHGVVGMINVRGEFSTAAKNATKKRHRRAAAPSAFPVLCFNSSLSLSLSLSLEFTFFTPTESVRPFVRLAFCSEAIKILSSHSPRYKSRRAAAPHRRGFHAHGGGERCKRDQ